MAMLLLFVWWGSIPVNFFTTNKNSDLNIGQSIVCFPKRNWGILQLKPQLTLNPTIFVHILWGWAVCLEAPLNLRLHLLFRGWGLVRDILCSRWRCVNHVDLWILMPWKCQNFVKFQRRSLVFFATSTLLGGGFKALHWTFWWDSHTLGSSSPIGPWAIKGKGSLIVWCEDWSFSTANVWLQTFKDVSWATGCGDLQAWMLSYVPLWFGNAECSCLWTVVVSPCWCTEGIRCF